MAVDDRAHVANRPRVFHTVAVDRPKAGIFVRLAERRAMDRLPVVIREVGVNQADRPLLRLHLYGERQGTQGLYQPDFGVRIASIEPGPAMLDVVNAGPRISRGTAQGHQVMVAADRMKPRAFEPSQNLWRFRPSIYQVAQCEEPVMFGLELDRSQRGVEPAEVAVNVPDGDIAPIIVNAEALDAQLGLLHWWLEPRLRDEIDYRCGPRVQRHVDCAVSYAAISSWSSVSSDRKP